MCEEWLVKRKCTVFVFLEFRRRPLARNHEEDSEKADIRVSLTPTVSAPLISTDTLSAYLIIFTFSVLASDIG